MKYLLALLCMMPAAFGAAPPVTVIHAWFRYLLPQIPAGGYMVLHNGTAAPVRLTGAQSPGCGSVMLHESLNRSGMDMMAGVGSVTIPPHGLFRFAPGGYHLMCLQPKMSVGATVPVTLVFGGQQRLEVTFAVGGPNGPSRRGS
jgi:copper(I)-binding protein